MAMQQTDLPAGSGATDRGGEAPIKLACYGVWKVFGHNAARFLAKHNYDTSYGALEATARGVTDR